MHDPHDPSEFELERTDAPLDAPAPPPPSRAPWILTAVLLIGAGIAVYFLFFARQAPEPAVVEAPPPAEAPAAPEPLGADAEPIDVPPLGESDTLVRDLVRALSSHPRVAAWLTTDDLIRNFTVVVDNIARGQAPAAQLPVLRPGEPFRIVESEDELLVDPRSYERYTQLAAAVDSVDPDDAAKLYTILKPRIEEAYRELGQVEPFDRALEQAIVMLLRTPAVDREVRLEPQGAVYQFQDPALERLTPAQKQLARMGPRNLRVIQARLREIALALGIPPERL